MAMPSKLGGGQTQGVALAFVTQNSARRTAAIVVQHCQHIPGWHGLPYVVTL